MAVFWSSIVIVSILNTSSETSLVNHLPSGVDAVLKIKNKNILKRFLFDALYSSDLSKNEFEQIKFNKAEVEIPNSGIQFSEDIYIFQDSWEDQSITGFLFKISDKNNFANFQSDRENIIKTFNNELGCIIMVPENMSLETLKYFELYTADLLVPGTDKLKAKVAFNQTGKESLLHLFFAGSSQAFVQDLSLEVSIEKSTIHFEGTGYKNPTIKYDSIEYHTMELPKNNSYLEVQAGQLPDSVYGFIDKVLDEFHIKLPDVASQQLFIYGFLIDNIDGTTAFLPKFDGIFRFDSKIELENQIDSLVFNDGNVQRVRTDKIRIGVTDYYFKQINSKEIWIGISENINIKEEKGAPLPRLSGSPEALLEIEGKGIIAQFAQMLPLVQYSKKLFSELENFDIHTELVSGNQIKVSGEMRFKDNKTASVELMKFLTKF